MAIETIEVVELKNDPATIALSACVKRTGPLSVPLAKWWTNDKTGHPLDKESLSLIVTTPS